MTETRENRPNRHNLEADRQTDNDYKLKSDNDKSTRTILSTDHNQNKQLIDNVVVKYGCRNVQFLSLKNLVLVSKLARKKD
jgi:hypothetical protein